jgi:hypothetical protein
LYRDLKSPPLLLPQPEEEEIPVLPEIQETAPAPQVTVPQVVPNLSINELFQKLVATGIINKKADVSSSSSSGSKEKEKDKEVEKKRITPVTFSRPETIKA